MGGKKACQTNVFTLARTDNVKKAYFPPEMEFLNSIFSRGINSSLLRLEFLSGFLPSFIRFTTAIHARLKFSCFADFLKGFLKPEKSTVFFEIRQWKGLCIKLQRFLNLRYWSTGGGT